MANTNSGLSSKARAGSIVMVKMEEKIRWAKSKKRSPGGPELSLFGRSSAQTKFMPEAHSGATETDNV